MELLQILNLEQLGTTGILIGLVLYLYNQELKERRLWQDRYFTATREYQNEVNDFSDTLSKTVDYIERSAK